MNFASDNWAGASESVIAALAEAASRGGPAYGADDLTKAVEARFAEVFEHEVAVFLLASGTAANALGLSAYARPGGAVLCHREAHILADEAGATEFFGGGLKVVGLDGVGGKLAPQTVADAMAKFPEGFVHHGQPVAVSLTEITELGTAYAPGEIAAIAEVAKRRGAALHMDGARFAGAVAGLAVSPADITWRAGVDVLSFGGTKNGCIAAEAVVFFDPEHARDFGYARQRAGHGFSKNWFIAAQLDAYLRDDHWLELARHANAIAAKLAAAIRGSGTARLAIEPAANEIFTVISKASDERLRRAGAAYYPWPDHSIAPDRRPQEDEVLVRLVTSWQTAAEEVERFAGILSAG
jgi:threonine aldolase